MLSGESVKEKKTAASFVVTFIFIGYASSNTRWDKTEAHIALHWIARLCALRYGLRWITPPFHQANLPTTASFLCVYRDTEHGCKSHAQIRRWHVPVALQ